MFCKKELKITFINGVLFYVVFQRKMCILDFIKNNNSSKKLLLKKTYCKNLMYKYNNIIHFNENLSMMDKNANYNISEGQLTNKFMPGRQKSLKEWGIDTAIFDFSSDERESGESCINMIENDFQGAYFSINSCCSCSSSFSFSNCNGCNQSICRFLF